MGRVRAVTEEACNRYSLPTSCFQLLPHCFRFGSTDPAAREAARLTGANKQVGSKVETLRRQMLGVVDFSPFKSLPNFESSLFAPYAELDLLVRKQTQSLGFLKNKNKLIDSYCDVMILNHSSISEMLY